MLLFLLYYSNSEGIKCCGSTIFHLYSQVCEPGPHPKLYDLACVAVLLRNSSLARTGTDVGNRRAATVARTLRALTGCIQQQRAAMRNFSTTRPARSAGGGVGGGGGAGRWGAGDGWESHGVGASETRLRLLTLQGLWLEIEGRMLTEQREVSM